MKRRSILALLGVGAVGGTGLYISEDISLPDEVDADVEDTFTDWGDQLQSRLNNQPAYGNITYATDTETATVTDVDFLEEIRVEPADTIGDVIRFRVPDSSELSTVHQLVVGITSPDGNITIETALDDRTVTFTGGKARIGSFVSASSLHPTEPVVILVRAPNERELSTVIKSINN